MFFIEREKEKFRREFESAVSCELDGEKPSGENRFNFNFAGQNKGAIRKNAEAIKNSPQGIGFIFSVYFQYGGPTAVQACLTLPHDRFLAQLNYFCEQGVLLGDNEASAPEAPQAGA